MLDLMGQLYQQGNEEVRPDVHSFCSVINGACVRRRWMMAMWTRGSKNDLLTLSVNSLIYLSLGSQSETSQGRASLQSTERNDTPI
jgi:hypothetical protein